MPERKWQCNANGTRSVEAYNTNGMQTKHMTNVFSRSPNAFTLTLSLSSIVLHTPVLRQLRLAHKTTGSFSTQTIQAKLNFGKHTTA